MTPAGIAVATLGALFVAGLLAISVLILGLRLQSPSIRRFVTTLQRTVVNPRSLETAGTASSPLAVVKHRGRSSGREFTTPVEATAVAGGFIIALPYGRETDWVRNVTAAATATLLWRGEEHYFGEVKIVPIASTPLADKNKFAIWLFGVQWALALGKV